MKKRYWIVGMLAACAMMSSCLFAQGTKESEAEPVTIRFSWWGGDTRHQATLKALDLYMQKNPNVTIEAEYSGFSGYYQKLVTQVVAGNAPDVFQVDQGWVSEFNNRGDVFANLDDLGIDSSKFNQSILNDYCYDQNKHLTVMPLGFNGTVFVYNTDLLDPYLEKYGYDLNHITWDGFCDLGAKIHADNPDIYLTTSMTAGYERFVLKPILEQIANDTFVHDDYTLGFTKNQMAQAFTQLLKLFDSHAAQPYEESVIYKDSVEDNPMWLNGKICGTFIFFSNIDRVTDYDYHYDVTRMPMNDGAKTTGQESAPSLMLGVNKNSKVQAEAAKFANWFLNDQEAAEILATQRGVPVNQDSLTLLKEKGLMSPIMSKAVDISNATMGFKNGALEMNASVTSILDDEIEKVIYHKVTPEEGAQELIDSLQKLFATMKK